jgi:MFS family permease
MTSTAQRPGGLLGKHDFGEGPGAEERYSRNMLALLSATLVISALSGGVLNVSFPVVVRHFNASATAASWLLLGSMLTSTSLIIMFGRLADMFGRVPIFMSGLVMMTVTSALAGLAPNIMFLTVVRMVQAGGTAMLLAVMAAMLVVSTPPEQLSKSMGIYMSALASASLAGPPIGALLADTVGWRWLFWFQAPFGLICIVWALRTLRPMPTVGERGRLDVPGVLLVAAVLSGMLVALSKLQSVGLTNPLVLGGIAVFVVGLPVFVVVETHTKSPLVDLQLFKQVSVAASNAAMLFGNMARMAVVLIGGLYFQAVEGNSTLVAAFKVLPLPLATALAGLCMGRISKWGTQQAIATVSAVVSGLGVVFLLFGFGGGQPYWVILVGFVIAGAGGGVFTPANTTAIMQEVPRERIGVVNAVRMMLMSAGGLLSTAISLALLTSSLPADLKAAVFAGNAKALAGSDAIDLLRHGYVRAIIVLLILNAIGILAAYIGQRAFAGDQRAKLLTAPDGPDAPIGPSVENIVRDAAEGISAVTSVEAMGAEIEAEAGRRSPRHAAKHART